jgi:hypothetical protein
MSAGAIFGLSGLSRTVVRVRAVSQCEAAHLRLSYLYKALSFRIGCGYHLEQLAHAIFLV